MAWLVRLALLVVVMAFGAPRADAQAPSANVALVIANSNYASAPALRNPAGDGRIVADALRRAGFTTVEVRSDLGRTAFEQALRSFQDLSDRADVSLIYYAGHGIEVGGRNWLIPTDARLATDRDLQFEAIQLDTLQGIVQNARRMRIIVLDACRDNPFARSMRRVGPNSRSVVSRGLAGVDFGDTLVFYAAREGTTATDGTGANSPFALAFARRIQEPGVELRFVLAHVRDDVIANTGRQQEPFLYGSISSQQFFFLPPSLGRPPAPAPSAPASAASSGSIAVDVTKLMSESLAGRSINTRLQQIAAEITAAFKPEADAIQREQTELAAATRGMSSDQIRANASLSERMTRHSTRATDLQTRYAVAQRDLEYTRQQAYAQLNNTLTPIVREMMRERGAVAVFDTNTAALVDPSIEVTDVVMSRLNARVTSVPVTRLTMPAAPATNPR